jgi:hypothetical protein
MIKKRNYIEGVLPRIEKSGQFTHLAVHSTDKASKLIGKFNVQLNITRLMTGWRDSETMTVLFPEKKYLA